MKKLIALLLALMLVLSLVACGAKEEAPADQPAEAPAETPAETPAEVPEEAPAEEEKEPVTLYIFQSGIDAIDAWTELLNNFEAEYPWVTCELMDDQENYFATVLTTGDMPDIINPNLNEIGKALVDDGLIADVSGTEVYKHISADLQEVNTYNGVCIGIPQGNAYPVLYYNMKILNEAGWDTVPTNRDELLQCCADVKAAGYAAFTTPGGQDSNVYRLFENILANTALTDSASYVEACQNGTFDYTACTETIEFLDALVPYMMEGTASLTDDEALTNLANGQVAMIVAGNWMSGIVVDAIATHTGDEALVGASLPPFNAAGEPTWISVSPETPIGMSGVDRGEAHNEARLMLFEYIWKPENYKILQNARGCVPVIDNMNPDDVVLDVCISELMDEANSAPTIPMGGGKLFTSEWQNEMRVALRDCYSGNISAAEALSIMTAAFEFSYLNME